MTMPSSDATALVNAGKAKALDNKAYKDSNSHSSASDVCDTTDVILPNVLPPTLARLIGSYLPDEDLEETRDLLFSAGACREDIIKRRKVRVQNELLPHIFSGKPDLVEKFLNQKGVSPEIILTDADFEEGYFSEELKEFVCFRPWKAVTPLQAAACTGDKFILENLIAHLTQDESLRQGARLRQNAGLKRDALLQLEAVQKGISDHKILLEAIEVLLKIEFEEDATLKLNAKHRLEEIQKLNEFQGLMESFRNEMEELRVQVLTRKKQRGKEKEKTTATSQNNSNTNTSCPADRKSFEERGAEKVTKTNFTKETEFLSAVIMLLKGYVYYCIQRPILASQNKWDEIGNIWEMVGECHKRVYDYIKQEFCDEKPFSLNPPPSFTSSPGRGPLKYYDDSALNLDALGFGTSFGLYKGLGAEGVAPWGGGAPRGARIDAWALAHLYKLRLTGLGNTIGQLRAPGPANTNISTNSSSGSKPF